MGLDASVVEIKRLLKDAERHGAGGVDERLLAISPDIPTLHALLSKALKENPSLVHPLRFVLEDGALVKSLQEHARRDTEAAAVIDFMSLAVEGCKARLRGLGDSEDEIEDTPIYGRFELYSGAASPALARISVDFLTHHARACFDARNFETTNLQSLLLASTLVPTLHALEFEHAKVPTIKAGPMYRYHPERMKVSRRYLKKALQARAAVSIRTEDQALAVMNAQIGMIIQEANAALLEFGLREKGDDRGMQPLYAEHDLLQITQIFVADGKQIFDMPPRLVDMLAHSDSDDLQVSQLKTPYRTQYIHVGPRPDIEFERGWRFDGAYVIATPERIAMYLTTVPNEPRDLRRWVYHAEPTFSFVFEADDFPLDIGTAVDVSVARWLAKLDEDVARAPELQAGSDEFASEFGLAPGALRVVTGERVTAERARILGRKEAAHAALTIVVNALCYLTAYPDDVERQWQPEAPADLVAQLSQGKTPGARRRAEMALNDRGYGIVHLCGMHFRKDPDLSAEMEGLGVGVRTHWRRGHFRNQPHGPQRALRKLVWIMPILVNAEQLQAGAEVPGRIYRVSGPSSLETRQSE